MARGSHTSPQTQRYPKRWKSRKKDMLRVNANREVIKNLYEALQ